MTGSEGPYHGVVRQWHWLAPITIASLLGACAQSSSPTTSGPPPQTGTSATVPPQTITTAASTTFFGEPEEPVVSAGWSLESGDFLVSGVEGIQVVRQGAVVFRPVTSPVEAAFSGETGSIFFVAPSPELFPEQWPTPHGGGGVVLWELYPNGSLQIVVRGDGSTGPIGALSILGVEDLGQLAEDFPSYRVTPIVVADPGDGPDVVWLTRIRPPTHWPRPYQPEQGDIVGAGWLDGPPGGQLFVAVHHGDEHWLERWTLYIGVSPWPNPAPRGTRCPDDPDLSNCLGTVTALPDTSLIAYTETDRAQSMTYVVLFDVLDGIETGRWLVAESPVVVKQLHASSGRIIVNLVHEEGDRYFHLPAWVIDIEGGDAAPLAIPGLASIVR